MTGQVLRWVAQSKEDLINREILTLLFNCVRAKGLAYREFQKTGKILQSTADEFISHVLILYEAANVLAGVDDKLYQKVMNQKLSISERYLAGEGLFEEIKRKLKTAGIFNVRKGAHVTNVNKGRAMMIGNE